MQCQTPISVTNDLLGIQQKVPCGNCKICRLKKRSAWGLRLKEEARTAETGLFITLTYTDQNLPYQDTDRYGPIPTLHKPDIIKFNKRLRKAIKKEWNHPYRYFIAGEYGDRYQRPHYHLLAFNIDHNTKENLHRIWNLGSVYVDTVNPNTVMYTTKYMQKDEKKSEFRDLRQKPFCLMSKNPPLGITWIQRQGAEVKFFTDLVEYQRDGKTYHRLIKKYTVQATGPYLAERRPYTTDHGFKMAIPRVFKDKLWEKQSAHTQLKEIKEMLKEQDRIDRELEERYSRYLKGELQAFREVERRKFGQLESPKHLAKSNIF